MVSSISTSTMKQYETTYRLWWNFCNSRQLSILATQSHQVISFLQHLLDSKEYHYGTFNSHRAALSLISASKLNEDRNLTRFMKGIYNLRPTRPRYSYTWNPQIVLDMLEKWDNTSISLENLSFKLSALLSLVTGHRIQTIKFIRLSNIVEDHAGIQILITDKIKTSGINRLQPCLQIPFYNNNPNLCVASTLKRYINVTKNLRPNNADFLFITHKRPYVVASKQSVSRWVKQTLKMAGINTDIFKPHSTRHAATSAAHNRGVSIECIMQAAGWLQQTTFTRFYKRQLIQKTEFAKAILSG